jgi:3-oxoacyl-[acyl-carrier protein] reductase
MGRSALVTGVSRRIGIAWTVAERLAADGFAVSATGWPAHDDEMPWGGDGRDPDIPGITWTPADLENAAVPAQVVAEHVSRHGSLDALVVVHARSSGASLHDVTAEELDRSFAVNTRATVLLIQAAAAAGVRRVVLFTTGVHRGPMPDEIPYIASKAAIQGITASLAAALARSATVNCINPGPVDTGYADDATRKAIASRFPRGRWGQPSDVAPLVSWLCSDEAEWITGQTIDIDGGWVVRDGVPPQADEA